MSALDIIILIAVILIVGAVIYFGFFNKKKNPCKGCAYAKECKEKACLNQEKVASKEETKVEEVKEENQNKE